MCGPTTAAAKPSIIAMEDKPKAATPITAAGRKQEEILLHPTEANDPVDTTKPPPPTSIYLRQNDVMSGRGSGVAAHPGNQRFRRLIRAYKPSYLAAPRNQKMMIAAKVIEDVEAIDPPGRFLERNDDGQLVIMEYKRAIEKTSQALRERPHVASSRPRTGPRSFTRNTSAITNSSSIFLPPTYNIEMMAAIKPSVPYAIGRNDSLDSSLESIQENQAKPEVSKRHQPTMDQELVGQPIIDAEQSSLSRHMTYSETNQYTWDGSNPRYDASHHNSTRAVSMIHASSVATRSASLGSLTSNSSTGGSDEETSCDLSPEEQFQDAVDDPTSTSLLLYYHCIQQGYLYS